jgi:hypothetical protein
MLASCIELCGVVVSAACEPGRSNARCCAVASGSPGNVIRNFRFPPIDGKAEHPLRTSGSEIKLNGEKSEINGGEIRQAPGAHRTLMGLSPLLALHHASLVNR